MGVNMKGARKPDKLVSARDAVQDILKGIAIILVVYGHMERGVITSGMDSSHILQHIDFIIYTTHMPLFFLLAGYNAAGSLQRHGAGRFVRTRGWALVYPYILWSFILWGMKLLTAGFATFNHPLEADAILNIWWQPISPFWFIYALLVMQLLLVVQRRRMNWYLPGSVALLALSELSGLAAPSIIWTILLHAPFFALGVWLAEANLPLVPSVVKRWWAGLALLAVFGVGNWLALTYRSDLPPVGIETVPVTLAGIGLLMVVSTNLPEGKGRDMLAYLGRLSLPIYLAHVFFSSVTRIILSKAGLHDVGVIIAVGTLTGVVAPVVIYVVAERLCVAGGWVLPAGRLRA